MKPIFTFTLCVSLWLSLHSYANHRDSVDVLHYDINLRITNFQQKIIEGFTTITFVPVFTNSSSFAFDLERLTIDSLELNGQNISFTHLAGKFWFTTTQPFSSTDTLTLTVYYHGTPGTDPSGWGGFYFSGQQAFNLGVGMAANPHVFGRAWFPCNDSFTDKSLYDFKIITLENHTASCGGILISEQPIGNGLKRWHWNIEQPTPTYLASVAVGEFQKIEFIHTGVENTVPIWVFAPLGIVSQATTAFSAVGSMLSAFENAFGPYPFPRVGYTVVNFSSGAMEHTMNIAFPSTSVGTSQSNRILMAHEFAHMWFGNNVTCASAEDMWLNEGWATWCESVYIEHTDGPEAAKSYLLNNHRYVLKQAHLQDGGFLPLYGISHQNTYGTTVYKKGADVVRTLRSYLGDSLFFPAIKAWFSQNAYSSKSTSAFCQFLSIFLNIDLQPFFDAWVYNPGFPHYSLTSFQPNNNEATISIGQLRYGGNFIGNANRVPVTFFANRQQSKTVLVMFDGEEGSAQISLPFTPQQALVDYYSTLALAMLREEKMMFRNSYSFTDHNITLYPQTQTDSAWIIITTNMVRPKERGQIFDGIELSQHYYWTIDMIPYGNFRAKARFNHTTYQNPADTTWAPPTGSRMEMLYRPRPQEPWKKLTISNSLTATGGYAMLDSLMPGEYAFGIWRYNITSAPNVTNPEEPLYAVYQRENGKLYIGTETDEPGVVTIYDLSGNVYETTPTISFPTTIHVNPYLSGVYILQRQTTSGKQQTIKILIIK